MHHNDAWVAVCRDLNQYTSQDVFLGPYLDDPAVRAKFSAGYTAMTDGFLVRRAMGLGPMPVCFPTCCSAHHTHSCFLLGCLLP